MELVAGMGNGKRHVGNGKLEVRTVSGQMRMQSGTQFCYHEVEQAKRYKNKFKHGG